MTESERQGILFYKARASAGMSQERLALEMEVSKKTISNWEKGFSSPTISDVIKAFKILGVNPASYLNAYVYSDQNESSASKLHKVIDSLPGKLQDELLYFFTGEHAMPPYYAIQLLSADLHLSLRSRIAVAQIILDEYKMEEALKELRNPEGVLPDIDALQLAIDSAKQAVMNGNNGYYPG